MSRLHFILLSVTSTIALAYPQNHISSVQDSTRTPIKSIVPDVRYTDQKVKLQLFYETLCPYCADFDPEFVKVAKKLEQYVDVHTYPYGNARMIKNPNGSVTVVCQHGEMECYGNMIHACAIDTIGDLMTALQYNACMMSRRSNDTAADQCGQQMKIPTNTVEAIKKCAKGTKGHQLLLQYGEESEKVGFEYVPYVLIDGAEWDQHGNFFNAVCAAFTSPPEPCQQSHFY